MKYTLGKRKFRCGSSTFLGMISVNLFDCNIPLFHQKKILVTMNNYETIPYIMLNQMNNSVFYL